VSDDELVGVSDSERILAWYELVQEVYEAREELSTSEQALKALLNRAASYFGLEELEHCRGPLPVASPPGQLLVPLSCVDLASEGVIEARSTSAAAASCPQHYLRARPGPEPALGPALGPHLVRFARHLARAMHINAGLSGEREHLRALYETLERQPLALVLLDLLGRVRFKNRAAIRMLVRHPEIQLDPSAYDVARTKSQPLGLLFQRIRQNLQRGAHGMVQHCNKTQMLTLIPLLSSSAAALFAPEGPSFALIIQERATAGEAPIKRLARGPQVPAGLSRRLQARFGLTPSEARLCCGLYAGLSVAGYATVAGRSALTLRKQLKAIYRKLNVHDQKALILRTWQEQQADWLECVTLATSSPSGAEVGTLLYPPGQTEAWGAGHLAPAQRALADHGHGHV
jgi:DNA-binding CsgD family transcriptional regulator